MYNKSYETKKSQEENEKNYTNASSHKSIRGWYFDFALSITRANSFLNTNLYICTGWGTLLKMASFLIVHIDQHIVIIISMKKGSCNWALKFSVMLPESEVLGTVKWTVSQQAKAKGHWNRRWIRSSSTLQAQRTQV